MTTSNTTPPVTTTINNRTSLPTPPSSSTLPSAEYLSYQSASYTVQDNIAITDINTADATADADAATAGVENEGKVHSTTSKITTTTTTKETDRTDKKENEDTTMSDPEKAHNPLQLLTLSELERERTGASVHEQMSDDSQNDDDTRRFNPFRENHNEEEKEDEEDEEEEEQEDEDEYEYEESYDVFLDAQEFQRPTLMVSSSSSSQYDSLSAAAEESKKEQNERATRLIGQKMLEGWALLQDTCPNPTCSE
ncbi:hypothetical protein BG004_006725, partial [Podila humilis]